MEVGDREQILGLGFDPQRLFQALALGAMPVAAGVVEGALTPTVIATLQVSSQGCGATRDQCRDDPGLLVAEVADLRCVLMEDLGQFRALGARAPLLAVRHLSPPRRLLLPQPVQRARICPR